jgi:hypothetical protein
MSIWTVPLVPLLFFLGFRLRREVAEARRSGVTNFTGQWPDGFSRDAQPRVFSYTVALYAVVAWFCLAVASCLLIAISILALLLVIRTIHPLVA